jgi:uncharacterized protein YbbK (DUF523 family)
MGHTMTRDDFRPGQGRCILVSACLLGVYCRYDGRMEADERVTALADRFTLIPVCPEQLGGLPTPRQPVELLQGKAVARDGSDLTEAFGRGVEQVVRIARLTGARTAVLQPRSPSCGIGLIYDGTFSGTRIPGHGMLAGRLADEDFLLCTPDGLDILG